MFAATVATTSKTALVEREIAEPSSSPPVVIPSLRATSPLSALPAPFFSHVNKHRGVLNEHAGAGSFTLHSSSSAQSLFAQASNAFFSQVNKHRGVLNEHAGAGSFTLHSSSSAQSLLAQASYAFFSHVKWHRGVLNEPKKRTFKINNVDFKQIKVSYIQEVDLSVCTSRLRRSRWTHTDRRPALGCCRHSPSP